MKSSKIPEVHFVGLGPGKAGTTYVYGYLDRHPNVSVGIIKESYFFSREFYRGRDWYLKIKKIGNGESRINCRAFGDISNQYFKDLSCIKRVESEFPNSRYIFFKREALARLISCFKFEKKMGYRGDMNEYLRTQCPSHFDNDKILNEIYQLVPHSSVFVVDFELLSSDSAEVFDKLTEFLGIPEFEVSDRIFSNPSVMPRSGHLAAAGRGVAKTLRRIGLYSLLQTLKDSFFVRKVLFSSVPIEVSDEEIELVRQFLNRG